MFIEYCDGGALDSIIVDLSKGLTERQIAYVCRQMCQVSYPVHLLILWKMDFVIMSDFFTALTWMF